MGKKKKIQLSSPDGVPAPRTPLHIAVDFRKNYSRSDSEGVLKNISISGAFLTHNESSLNVNDKLTLTFRVSGRERTIPAMVVWSNSKGSGVQFLPENQRDVQIIDDLIYFVESKRSGTRDILEKIFRKVG